MNTNENLDLYQDAYKEQFKFHNENHWYLTWYSRLICDAVRARQLKSILSLGIGHQVVCSGLAAEQSHGLEKHHILDGSKEIIRSYLATRESTFSTVEETFFEDFESDETFDAIEMGFVLEHVDDPMLLLKRYRKFLDPSGVLFIAVPNARSLHRLIGHHAGLLDDVYQLSPHDHQLGHKRYFDLDTIRMAVKESGFHVTAEKGLMLKPITGDQIEKLGFGENLIHALFVLGEDYPEIANCIYLEASMQP